MGSSGSICHIDLEKYTFDDIKSKMMEKLLEFSSDYYSINCEATEYYFKVAELKNINEFVVLFWAKIAKWVPEYGGEYMPMVDGNILILYETDQQMSYQNLPWKCLSDLCCYWEEIWT